jgi:hypothetical protein
MNEQGAANNADGNFRNPICFLKACTLGSTPEKICIPVDKQTVIDLAVFIL